ncbi:hypothetical protein CFP56_039093 [Quercus suber]|uniref:Uncharacterized protein n=1 Tax=Quercus suber TaxID=58331 RepID=A0AAW0LMH9_QUESU
MFCLTKTMVKADSICGCTLSLSGPPSGNDGGHGTSGQGLEGGYGGASAEAPDVTTEELRELFGGIGQARQEGRSSLTSSHESSPGLGSPYPWLRLPRSEEGGLQLIELLGECASHVIARCLHSVNTRLEHISYLASIKGIAI